MFFSSLVMPNFIIDVRANLSGNHKTISVTRGAQGTRLLIEMLPMIKMITQSLLFLQFQFSLHFSSATVTGTTAVSSIINIDDQGPRAPQLKFLPTNLNVQAGRNSMFFSKRCHLTPSVFIQ